MRLTQDLTAKAIPSFTLHTIMPPYTEYVYFQHGAQVPFRETADAFDPVNAWWLSEAATLAYADDAFAHPRFQQAGFEDARFFSGASTECFVVWNARVLWVIFRGTETRKRPNADDFANILADIKADCNILPVAVEQGGSVHKGFHAALDEVWELVCACLSELHTAERRLWFAGHSLGAALATLAAARYGRAQGVYTFGSPRVGNAEFRDRYPVPIYRVVNGHDVVATVPLPPLYRHVGDLWHITSAGTLQPDPPNFDRLSDSFRGEARNIADTLRHLKNGNLLYIPGGFKDHIHLLYAIHLWNNVVRAMSDE